MYMVYVSYIMMYVKGFLSKIYRRPLIRVWVVSKTVRFSDSVLDIDLVLYTSF